MSYASETFFLSGLGFLYHRSFVVLIGTLVVGADPAEKMSCKSSELLVETLLRLHAAWEMLGSVGCEASAGCIYLLSRDFCHFK